MVGALRPVFMHAPAEFGEQEHGDAIGQFLFLELRQKAADRVRNLTPQRRVATKVPNSRLSRPHCGSTATRQIGLGHASNCCRWRSDGQQGVAAHRQRMVGTDFCVDQPIPEEISCHPERIAGQPAFDQRCRSRGGREAESLERNAQGAAAFQRSVTVGLLLSDTPNTTSRSSDRRMGPANVCIVPREALGNMVVGGLDETADAELRNDGAAIKQAGEFEGKIIVGAILGGCATCLRSLGMGEGIHHHRGEWWPVRLIAREDIAVQL